MMVRLNYGMIAVILLSLLGIGLILPTSTTHAQAITNAPDAPGTITGAVMAADGVTPVPDALVYVNDAATGAFVAFGYGDANGVFTVALLPPGSYVLQATGDGVAPEFFGGAAAADSAQPVIVTAGATVVAVDFALDTPGHLTGTVIAQNSARTPLADVEVRLYDAQGAFVEATTTRADGGYQFADLAPGTYRVAATQLDYIDSVAPLVTVVSAAVARVDVALASPGAISGVITGADGVTPLDSAAVYVYDYTSRQQVGMALTAPDGWYSVGSLSPGEYLVQAVKAGRVGTYTAGSTTPENAPPILVESGDSTDAVNFALAPAGFVTGSVLEQDGITPIANATVYAYTYGTQAAVAWTEADANGLFNLAVPAGTYRLTAYQFDYATQHYGGTDENDAQPITVTAGNSASGMSFTLAGISIIRGTVYQPDGITPVGAGVSVAVYDSITDATGTFFTTTIANGTYSRTVPDGTYYMQATSVTFGSIYYDGKLSLALADPVVGASTTVTGINMTFFAPANAATLTAALTLQGRAPAPTAAWSIPVAVTFTPTGSTSAIYGATVTTDQNGVFTVTGIPAGTYQVRVKNAHTLASSFPVTLVAGANTVALGTLREGDADGNNLVNITDFSLLATSFGKTQGTTGFNANADFNEDDIVNVSDFSLLAQNFNQIGAP